MKTRISTVLAIVLLSLVLTIPVIAGYYINIDVEESNDTDYDMLAMNVSLDIDYLADNGFINEDGLDVRVQTSDGSTIPFMPVEDKLMFASAIEGDKTTGFQMTTGNTPLDSFPIIVGHGGNVTVGDHANLELGQSFSIAFEGYLSTAAADLVDKDGAVHLYFDDDDDFHAVLESPRYSYYREGEYEDDWVPGWTQNNYELTQEDDHLSLIATYDGGTSGCTYVTDSTIDLTGINTIYIDWENTTDRYSYFVADTDKNNDFTDYDARIGKAEAFARTTDSLDVSGLSGGHYLRAHAYAGQVGATSTLKVYNVYRQLPNIDLENADMVVGEYTIELYVDSDTLKLDIDGATEDSASFPERYSAAYNANDWVLYPDPYWNYYTHTTSDTLRVTYAPDDIITGTTLINETNPGTHDGAIAWGLNPAGISIETSGLLLDESYYFTPGGGDTLDIFAPEPAELAPGQDSDKLDHNPLAPGVEGFAAASNGAFTESLVWYGIAWFSVIAVAIALVVVVREHLVLAAAASFGLSIFWYVAGVLDYWVLIIFGIFFAATLIHERMPTW